MSENVSFDWKGSVCVCVCVCVGGGGQREGRGGGITQSSTVRRDVIMTSQSDRPVYKYLANQTDNL